MLPFPGAKSTRREDISNLVFEAIARERGEATAALTVPACRALQELRTAASEPPTTAEVRKRILSYLAALKFFKREIALSAPLDNELAWVSAFEANASCTAPSLDLDYISSLFNLAVCEASLGVSDFRQHELSPAALSRAAKHFAAAASAFRLAAAVPTPGGHARTTVDLTPECLDACEQLMLGNAQQCMYVQASRENPSGNFYHKINALFAAGAAHYYSRAADICGDPRLSSTAVNAAVGAPAAALAGYHTAIAEISQAHICDKHCRMSEKLARLRNARIALDRAKEKANSIHAGTLQYLRPVQAALLTKITELDTTLKELQESTDLENKHVYFGLDPDKTTAPIAIREAISNDIAPVIEKTPVDERLTPLSDLPNDTESNLRGVSSRYAAVVVSTVGAQLASLSTASAHLRETVVQAESALDASQSSSAAQMKRPTITPEVNADDEKAVEDVRKAKESGGWASIKESYSQAIELAQGTKAAIAKIEETLAAEEDEDRHLRSRVAISRPDSKTVAASFLSKIAQSKSDVGKAASADEVVDLQLKHHEPALRALDALDISELAPSISKHKANAFLAAGAPPADVAMGRLRTLLSSAQRMLLDSSALQQELDQKRHLENPIAATARILPGPQEPAQLQSLVQATYGPLCGRGDALSARMRDSARDIARARTALSATGSAAGELDLAAESARRRVDVAYRHHAAALKHEELRVFLADGMRFYTREQKALASLAADVNAFAAARSAEAARLGAHASYAPPHHPQYHVPPPPGYGMQPQYHGAYNAPYAPAPLHAPHQPPPPPYWQGAQPPHDPRAHR